MINIESLIKDYIAGKSSEYQLKAIDKLRKNDNAVELLFELIEACLKKTTLKFRYSRIPKDLNQDDIEILIMRLLTFNIRKKDAFTLLQQLYHNPRFYEQLKPSLSVATTPYSHQMKAPDGIKVHDDARIFNYLDQQEKSAKKSPQKTGHFFWMQKLQHLQHGLNSARGPAIVFVSVTAFMIAAYTFWDNPARTEIYKSYLASDSAYLSQNFSNNASQIASNTLRGSSTTPGTATFASALNKISTEIDIARDYYELQQFKKARALFEDMSLRILAVSEQPEALPLMAQYNFYLGMTHLGISGKKIAPKSHVLDAIVHLKKADEFIKRQNGRHQDDILFFLGFAHTLVDDKETADYYLAQIPPNSPFYQQTGDM